MYVSAEDVFRPLISARYIETKREAEQGIEEMILDRPDYRGVYIRPSKYFFFDFNEIDLIFGLGLVYHPHYRPLTTPIAALLDLSASIHSNVPPSIPTPSRLLRALGSAFPSNQGSSPLESIANVLTIPPIHVDHVAGAICVALGQQIRGAVGVRAMRELIGWSESGDASAVHVKSTRTISRH